MKKKSGVAPSGEERCRADMETVTFGQLIPLVEHLAVTKYEDGDPREPGWITIKTHGKGWIVQVKDPDSGMSFQALGNTLDGALETANLLLGCDEAPWEVDPWLKKRGSKKSK